MSSELYWRPAGSVTGPLDNELKLALQKKYGHMADGIRMADDISTMSYLEGLRDAGIKDAEVLLNLIERYGYIELFTQS